MTEQKQCCPKFDPAPWDGQVHVWENKAFVRDHIRTFFYMPLNFGAVAKRLSDLVTGAGQEMKGWVCLSDHTSKWNMDVYLGVDKPIAGADNATMSGRFLTKVYDGPFKDTDKWMKDFDSYAKGQGHKVKKIYMWYTTCPKCAKKYGHNYNVVVGELE